MTGLIKYSKWLVAGSLLTGAGLFVPFHYPGDGIVAVAGGLILGFTIGKSFNPSRNGNPKGE
jgi:hypothetical protein